MASYAPYSAYGPEYLLKQLQEKGTTAWLPEKETTKHIQALQELGYTGISRKKISPTKYILTGTPTKIATAGTTEEGAVGSKEFTPPGVESITGEGIPGGIGETLRYLAPKFEEEETGREERYKAGLGDLAQMAGLFGPGYGAGLEHTALTGAKQSLIGRGLGGTTRPMAVSGGLKAHFEDLRRGKLAEALTRMAEYRRTFPESTATANVLAALATGGYGQLSAAQQMELGKQQQRTGESMLSSLLGGIAGGAGSGIGQAIGDVAGGFVSNIFSGGLSSIVAPVFDLFS